MKQNFQFIIIRLSVNIDQMRMYAIQNANGIKMNVGEDVRNQLM